MTGSSSDACQELSRWEPASAVGRFSLWRRRRGGGGGGQQGVAPLPSILGRAGLCPSSGEPQRKERGLIFSLGFLLSSKKERVKVNLRLT